MRIRLIAATIAGALACATLGAAVATASSGAPDKAEVATADPAGVVPPATAPNARAAALVRSTRGNHPSGTFVRQKGFLRINHPLTGVYCLKLQSTIDEDTLVASVTPEYFYSPDFNITALWNSPHYLCPLNGNWVEVRTYNDDHSGRWDLADEAFSIVIP